MDYGLRMSSNSVTWRIALSLAAITVTITLAAQGLGFAISEADVPVGALLRLVGFMFFGTLLAFQVILRRLLGSLSRVMPARFKSALDSLAEGLMMTDREGRIVMVNEAFTRTTGRKPADLIGRSISSLPWICKDEEVAEPFPWMGCLRDGEPRSGAILGLPWNDRERTFVVSASPIRDESGDQKGVIASFDDVTRLEQRTSELSTALQSMKKSAEDVRAQNRHLERLATRDSLTGCLNRRAFFERFEQHWARAARTKHRIACMMVDIDHFKSINDNYGHAMGDRVLQQVGETLQRAVRETDVVARYGGEEFCIVMPHSNLSEAQLTAEHIRQQIGQLHIESNPITASFGIASGDDAGSPQEMLEQADKALYLAKRSGRNCVVRHDQVPAESGERAPEKNNPATIPTTIPFPAVSALTSALAYRDQGTALHSRRVADLCVAVAEGMMPLSQCYVLEMAALLHDIGKIGVPDAILLKPGPLTGDEWEMMRRHDQIGAEIVRSSFASEELSAIIENYRARWDEPLSAGQQVPVGARILSVADAYDSMTTDKSYRKAMSEAEALAELERCAGTQFDPAIVTRFVDTVILKVRQRRRAARAELQVSREAALKIGLELERMTAALDREDLAGLGKMAGVLKETARQEGVELIAAHAAALEKSVADQGERLDILRSATELLDHCRETQSGASVSWWWGMQEVGYPLGW